MIHELMVVGSARTKPASVSAQDYEEEKINTQDNDPIKQSHHTVHAVKGVVLLQSNREHLC